jgi:hypothetical protein
MSMQEVIPDWLLLSRRYRYRRAAANQTAEAYRYGPDDKPTPNDRGADELANLHGRIEQHAVAFDVTIAVEYGPHGPHVTFGHSKDKSHRVSGRTTIC